MLLRAVLLACVAASAASPMPARRAVAGAWNYDRSRLPLRPECCASAQTTPGRCADPSHRALVRNRCDSANGPAAWPGSSASSHCDAAEQSPINLCGAAVHPQAPSLTLAAGYATAQTYKFSADGKAYLDAAGLDLTLDAGNLVRLRPQSHGLR
jgi:hypothetical protein